VYFSYLLPVVVGNTLSWAVITTILIKAIIEVIVMSVIMAALAGNKGFKDFATAHFTGMKTKEKTPPQP
jgi:hypothetical protein